MLVSDEVRQLSDANELRRYGPGFPLILNDQWKVWRSHENYFSGRCHHPSYCRPRLGTGVFMVKVSVLRGIVGLVTIAPAEVQTRRTSN